MEHIKARWRGVRPAGGASSSHCMTHSSFFVSLPRSASAFCRDLATFSKPGFWRLQQPTQPLTSLNARRTVAVVLTTSCKGVARIRPSGGPQDSHMPTLVPNMSAATHMLISCHHHTTTTLLPARGHASFGSLGVCTGLQDCTGHLEVVEEVQQEQGVELVAEEEHRADRQHKHRDQRCRDRTCACAHGHGGVRVDGKRRWCYVCKRV